MVHEENLRKNWSLDIVKARLVDLKSREISWGYMEGRILSLQIDRDLEQWVKYEIQYSLDLQFGPGKVKVF